MNHRAAWPALIGVLLGCAWGAGHALAASSLDRSFGTPELGVSARLRGMGGAGGALGDGALGLLDNPVSAVLSGDDAPGALRLQVSGDLARQSEDRMVPLYDTFDNYVHETAIAINDHGYGAMNFGLAYAPRPLGGFVLSLSSIEAWDPRYDYRDERRSTATTDQIVAERVITTTGALRQTGFGLAHALPFGLSAGAALHVYVGTFDDRDALIPRQNGVSGSVTETRRALHGVSLALGAAWRANERLTGAASWESGPRLSSKVTSWANDSVVVGPDVVMHEFRPPRVHLSGAYRPSNTVRTTFAADVVWCGWSQLADIDQPGQPLLDTWDVRFGLEHRFLRDLPGRMGFRYERSPYSREADRAWFTFGLGWQVQRIAIDAGFEVGKRTSRQDPVWPRAEQAGSIGAGQDLVQDTSGRATLGLEVKL